MKTSTINHKVIGILRGLMPRDAQREFSNSFTKFKSVFLTEKNLGQENIFGIDPIKILLGRSTHQSWVGVNKNKLLNVSKDLDYLETYELYHFFSAQAAIVCNKLNIPLITEVWTSFSSHPAYFIPPYSWNVKKVINNTSLFIARSVLAGKALINLGVPKSKIKVIYHGVDLNKFKPSAVVSNHKTFLFVGEMEKYKGVEVILNAWRKYYRNHPKDKLFMAGKGTLAQKANSTSGVAYLGYVDHDKLPAIYRSANVFISPSINRYIGPFLWWEEFFSYTLMEAMASGLSIIGSDSGGIPEEIGDKNIIIRQESVDDLVRAMENINVKNSNRKRAEKLFDLRKNTSVLESVLLKLN